jgi:hypothetical protein
MDHRHAHSTAPPHVSPPASAPGSVRFPWEPAQHNHQHDHTAVNAAGLHSAFAHHPFHAHNQSSSASHSRSASRELPSGQHLSFDPNLPTGKDHADSGEAHNGESAAGGAGIPMSKSQSLGGLSYQSSTTAGGQGILSTSGGKDFPRSRTSSTGQTTMIGPDFGYRRKVGFETFDGAKVKDDALFSYTLQVCQTFHCLDGGLTILDLDLFKAKSDEYRRNRNTRVFMAAVSNDEKGEDALDWLMDNLVEDGDEIIAVRVIELDEGGQSLQLGPLLRLLSDFESSLEKASHHAQEEFREEAAELLKTILEKNDEFGGDRRVSATVWYPNSKLMTFRYFRYP